MPHVPLSTHGALVPGIDQHLGRGRLAFQITVGVRRRVTLTGEAQYIWSNCHDSDRNVSMCGVTNSGMRCGIAHEPWSSVSITTKLEVLTADLFTSMMVTLGQGEPH